MKNRFRVGIVGVSTERGWGTTAHIPALRALSDVFETAGVANTSLASAKAAAAAFGIPRAFESVAELVASQDIDVVAVTVKVPHHREVVAAALKAGKHVYCEWPLGTGLAEATELAELARRGKVRAVVGTQATASPEVEMVRKIVADGYVGDVLSSTYLGSGPTWGDEVTRGDSYVMDSRNSATMLAIIGGHAIAAVQSVLGPMGEVHGVLSQRRKNVRIVETGNTIPMQTHDHVMVNAVLKSGAPLSVEIRGGLPRGIRLLWEINGTLGDIRVTATNDEVPVINITPLRVEAGRNGDQGYRDIEIEKSHDLEFVASRNVAAIYRQMAEDLARGTSIAPDFDDAVALHRVIDAIEKSDQTGKRVRID
ncbi:Gfo/Idh/MocA family protein [Caballeronia ptereochthonis]|uniref:Oxidoreductase domain-containing protein n=1 Tax=Caballeronia ptereochthonis TaxID=1777144 RepID=A0A158AWC4_9BURK|nr:Gfo/Idh/MocA family oxidoreductase [Caballeronia ptereochthonis]SAK62019.1 oxidoreductase domain-containing protein [Caballeronia ptereochthonis]